MMKSKSWPIGVYGEPANPDVPARGAQKRPSVAKMLVPRSLRGRLLLLIAVVVAVVIGATEYMESRLFERAAVAELSRNARSTAFAVADDLELRWTNVDETVMAGTLHDFLETMPAVRSISVIGLASDGGSAVLASTASAIGEVPLAAGREAATTGATIERDAGRVHVVAAPLRDDQQRVVGAVVVAASVAVVDQVRRQSWRMTLWLAPLAILAVVGLVDLLTARLVHRPLSALRATMDRTARGDLTARTRPLRRDELGHLAEGLNRMLDQLQDFNVALQQRVDEATATLKERNSELIDSHERVIQLRDALASAERMAAVGYMAASVAHQVGTPLNLVSGYVQIMRQDPDSPERLDSRLAIVAEQIEKVTAELRRILDHARPPTSRAVVAPADLVQRVCDLARDRLDRQGVRLELTLDRDAAAIEADSVQLEMALLNLVSNSLDAMPDGGVLAVDVARFDDSVRITLRDSGSGIPKDVQARVFEPWVTTKPPGRGTGLGLTIARDVFAAHGGSMDIRSEAGSGTQVVIELPAAREPADATT